MASGKHSTGESRLMSKSLTLTDRGYIVSYKLDGQYRTYVCCDQESLCGLIARLTDRPEEIGWVSIGYPLPPGISVAHGVHIYRMVDDDE